MKKSLFSSFVIVGALFLSFETQALAQSNVQGTPTDCGDGKGHWYPINSCECRGTCGSSRASGADSGPSRAEIEAERARQAERSRRDALAKRLKEEPDADNHEARWREGLARRLQEPVESDQSSDDERRRRDSLVHKLQEPLEKDSDRDHRRRDILARRLLPTPIPGPMSAADFIEMVKPPLCTPTYSGGIKCEVLNPEKIVDEITHATTLDGQTEAIKRLILATLDKAVIMAFPEERKEKRNEILRLIYQMEAKYFERMVGEVESLASDPAAGQRCEEARRHSKEVQALMNNILREQGSLVEASSSYIEQGSSGDRVRFVCTKSCRQLTSVARVLGAFD